MHLCVYKQSILYIYTLVYVTVYMQTNYMYMYKCLL